MLPIELANRLGENRTYRGAAGQALPTVFDAVEQVRNGRSRDLWSRRRPAGSAAHAASDSHRAKALAAMLAATDGGELGVRITENRVVAAGIDLGDRRDRGRRSGPTGRPAVETNSTQQFRRLP